jgi:hypothetical protein
LAAERIPAGCDQLAPVLRAALGGRRQLRRVTRLAGGSKKGVYRAVFDDESTAIVYIWAAGENYWPASSADASSDPAGPFSPASGLNLFQAAQERLAGLGIRARTIA